MRCKFCGKQIQASHKQAGIIIYCALRGPDIYACMGNHFLPHRPLTENEEVKQILDRYELE